MTVLSWPLAGVRVPAEIDWWLEGNTFSFASPLTGSKQTQENPGARWRATVVIDSLPDPYNRIFAAFLAQMRGEAGRVYYGPENFATPRGSASSAPGTPLVNGASQTGLTLAIDGCPNSATGYLKAGDFISFNTSAGRELHQLTADANTNGSGQVTLAITPPIRTSPADNAAVTVSGATCIMKLVNDAGGKMRFSTNNLGTATIDLEEAFF